MESSGPMLGTARPDNIRAAIEISLEESRSFGQTPAAR